MCPSIRLGSIVMRASPMTLLASGKEPKDPRKRAFSLFVLIRTLGTARSLWGGQTYC